MVEALIISNILLWIVIVIMGLMLFALVRQIGVLYERVAPAGALMINQNLKVGGEAPSLDLQDIKGGLVTIGGVPENGKSKLLFFVSPTCPVCKTLLPVVKSADKSEKDWLDVILASDGENNDHNGYINEHQLEKFTYISSEILGRSYGVSKLPYAVLIDEQGKIASMGIINSREHLESLFESKERGVASIQEYIKTQTGNEKDEDLPAEAQ
ncbi:MAG: methylamine dehydrogenase accessory protein MauD [Gammaproteobacteria bacterium]|jgi:methylamine dehydrogenase accessory protein MauD|nr:methylamine dehydrogenase accessory protein MauD [Gammaproteobacteria bacterium]